MDYLANLCKQSEQITHNKLQLCVYKYESFVMLPGKNVQQMESRFNALVSELSYFGREYPVAELIHKIIAEMPRDDRFVKVTTLKERDL